MEESKLVEYRRVVHLSKVPLYLYRHLDESFFGHRLVSVSWDSDPKGGWVVRFTIRKASPYAIIETAAGVLKKFRLYKRVSVWMFLRILWILVKSKRWVEERRDE